MDTHTRDARPGEHLIAVVGAGVMGVGIATLALVHGLPVVLVDVDDTRLADARTRIAAELRMAELMGRLADDAAAGPLRTTTALADLAAATVVIEAATEDIEVKAKVLAELSTVVEPGTPLVSNTSSIPIDELAGFAQRPQDVVGTHFMNPPYLIRTVEVIRGARTGEHTMAALGRALAALGREPVVVRDSPGFVTSRILHPMINAAARIVEQGTASVEAVDALMENCLGHRTGPLRTADLIGIDNLVDSLRVLHDRTGDEGCRPCGLLLEKVRTGHHGRKSGRGFYDYTN
ncbi:3-hydroxyacyl-CoA dehydrogenase family protein [Nocardia terpenica]|uniref:3-hydroxyacyl-CoA dehydrogenase family protein n=1 Tax=Nocardia terpenica TaxID=455432 RepID=UPI00189521C7|nr:3-hydroxyacyl-CoA dehydrogenase family protein [Nocardia terpenica]MBF6059299.1 3-hydroxyacyl-CoA dehydrogenase family protein [Nocardia terpenica]MBF6103162.1 3-hydroxyacyl-CoA dehydrogenase family protein [Nocardia terpenica]MBF6110649.1 3-hydroxyacyl-CoA dehydrogenase family protein [Nocardia terpenica]MBF6116780.1 3-hydroxyacyl-CoA dehydrogenase family protein [Nocardia terpenica]